MAQQEAERAKFIVEKATQEKEGAIVRAQGEAQSARLIGQAIQQNPAFLTLRKIEVGARLEAGVMFVCTYAPHQLQCFPSRHTQAAREIAHTVAGAANRVYLSADTLLLNLPTNNVK